MTVTAKQREKARQRAQFACEYCGVSESDTGRQLTIDHFQPTSKGGSDNLDNLVYCCIGCNQHKGAYWPTSPNQPLLWNPRRESRSQHIYQLDDGTWRSVTTMGSFTLRRLQLNRPALVAWQQNKRQESEQADLLIRYRELTELLEGLLIQQADMIAEQQTVVQQQQELLRQLIGNRSWQAINDKPTTNE